MATEKQKKAACANIKKAQQKWQSMSKQERSRKQPTGRKRAKPGTTGEGDFYRIEVRPKNRFTSFRTHDVGEEGKLERIAGQRKSGSWDTATWLVEKSVAHMNDDNELVIDDKKARSVLDQIRGPITHKKGDIFTAKPR